MKNTHTHACARAHTHTQVEKKGESQQLTLMPATGLQETNTLSLHHQSAVGGKQLSFPLHVSIPLQLAAASEQNTREN